MSEKIAFNVDAYTPRLIGRENVSTLDGELLELIKNGRRCKNEFFLVMMRMQ